MQKLMTPGKWFADFDDNGNATLTCYEESFRELLGYESEDEFANDQESWAAHLHPDDVERVNTYFDDIMSKHPEGKDYDIEYRILTKWGYRWFHDYARITRRENGSVLHFEGVSFDIQEIKDFEIQQKHDNLRKEVLDFIVNHDDDPIELLSQFAEKIRAVLDCDQVIYRDLEKTRIMVNSPAIEKTWSVPFEYCKQCQHLDAHHPMYAGGFTEMDNCQEGWQGIPVFHKCPIKSSLTRLVYCNGEIAGYLAIHYVQKYHHFTDLERKTVEDFTSNLSLILSRYETGKMVEELKEKQNQQHNMLVQNNQRVMALEDNLESLYDVELETGNYTEYVKGDFYQSNIAEKLLPRGDYFEDLRGNIDAVIYPDDRDSLNQVLQRESIRKALSETDRIEHYYRVYVGDTPQWFKIRIVYKDAEKKTVIIGCFNASEELEAKQIEEQRAQIAEQTTFTNFFLDTYVSAYYVNLDTLSCKVYKRTEQLERDYPIITNYYDSVKDYINNDVHPDDRRDLLENVAPARMRELLDKQIAFTHIFRDISCGKEKTYRLQVIRGGEANHAAFGFLDITDEINEQNRRLKEAEETRKLVENIASEYNMAWTVNMEDDTFKILRRDTDVAGGKKNFKNFSEAKAFFLGEVCHPADRERMRQELDYDNIREKLAGKRYFETEYRELNNGTTTWNKMNVTSIAGDDIALGFVKKDLEIVRQRLEEKTFRDYLALYVVDLDTETIKPFKRSNDDRIIEDAAAAPFSDVMSNFTAKFEGEAKTFFERISNLDYIRSEFEHDEKRSFAYKNPEGLWVDFTCYVIARHEDGTPSMCAFGYSCSDALSSERNEMQQQIEKDQELMRENMEIISGLANEYHALYYVNIKEGFFKIYSIDEKRFPEAKHMVDEGQAHVNVFRQFGESPLVHPDDRHLFRDLDTPKILDRLAHSKKFTRMFRRKFGDEYLWTEMEFIKYEDVDTPANIIAVGFAERDAEIRRDQEQRQQLETAFKLAQAASEAKSNFLFNMSHDIRTPMNAITGFTAMAKKNAGDKDMVLDYLNKIDVSGQQLLMLINQVLEMSRIESGKVEFEEHPVNVRERFDAMVTVLSEQAEVRGQEFHSSLHDIKHPYVFADDARMGQITLNIVGNAMKYTPEGGQISFSIREIPARKEGYGTFVFTVADTGIGMSKEFIEKLYEPFARENTSTVSQIQGTGLGMSIVKSLVDLAGGKIEVHSEQSKGTRFDITMDFKIDDKAKDLETLVKESSAINFKGKRVLLVEDNELNREIARYILEDKGLVIEDAEDGDIAVEKMAALAAAGDIHHYDFILMDVQMPRMNGYEATGKIREILDPLGVHIPIIALSANAFEEDKVKSRAAGMDDHIAKPIDVDHLWMTLVKFL